MLIKKEKFGKHREYLVTALSKNDLPSLRFGTKEQQQLPQQASQHPLQQDIQHRWQQFDGFVSNSDAEGGVLQAVQITLNRRPNMFVNGACRYRLRPNQNTMVAIWPLEIYERKMEKGKCKMNFEGKKKSSSIIKQDDLKGCTPKNQQDLFSYSDF